MTPPRVLNRRINELLHFGAGRGEVSAELGFGGGGGGDWTARRLEGWDPGPAARRLP
jgi:hypothetical protein